MGLKSIPAILFGCATIVVSSAIAQVSTTVPILQQVGVAESTFTNWENPHVHPLDITPDGTKLLAVNTADNRLEVFGLANADAPRRLASIPVGLAPVSVRAFDNNFAVVVNHISDSISIINLNTMGNFFTVNTADEPADVVFAGTPLQMYVSCSLPDIIQVFNLGALDGPAIDIPLVGQDPRALAVSPDGLTVYTAVFEAGNRTTILAGGGGFSANAVNDPIGPYGGVNPPPNTPAIMGGGFTPPETPGNPPALAVGLIVRDVNGQWLDDNLGDWTDLVSGANAAASGRPVGWELLDHDVAQIDTTTLAVTYTSDLMANNMALAVNPADGNVFVVGIEAFNDIRFEPNITGRFVQARMASFDPALPGPVVVTDLNPQLAGLYPQRAVPTPSFTPLPQIERDRAVGDPRGIAFSSDGSRVYVTGMGSNNVVVYDSAGNRVGLTDTIEVGEGPTGIVLNSVNTFAYVQNKFDASISVIDLVAETEVVRVSYYDPTPTSIKVGRKHLYDTHKTSGLGQASCASCHLDSRMDRKAWDLGNPAGAVKPFDQNCLDAACEDWHPMKGPMTTQTLQDIVGKEPFHWRGDKFGLEDFNPAFVGLLGDDVQLTTTEMQEFEDFIATIHFPPNPFRNLDNTLSTNVPLEGHFWTGGTLGIAGDPLPNGDAEFGLQLYRLAQLDGVQCVTCHTLQTGAGPDAAIIAGEFVALPPGPFGERHLALVSGDGSTNKNIKIPQTRNMHEKNGFNTTKLQNDQGFGYLHDGSVDSIERFQSIFEVNFLDPSWLSHLTAFMLSFSGSDMPVGTLGPTLEPLGPTGRDTHAAVGTQITFDTGQTAAEVQLLTDLLTIADTAAIGVVAHGIIAGQQRGFFYSGLGTFQSDIAADTFSTSALIALAIPGNEVTFTAVPVDSAVRIGVDQDDDTFFNVDELLACASPTDPFSTPNNSSCCLPDFSTTNANPGDPGYGVPDGMVNGGDLSFYVELWLAGDVAADLTTTNSNPGDPGYGVPDGAVNGNDLSFFVEAWLAGCP